MTPESSAVLDLAELAASAIPGAAPLVAGFKLVRKLIMIHQASAAQIAAIDVARALDARAVANAELEDRADRHPGGAEGQGSDDAEALTIIQARHFRPWDKPRRVLWVFMHSMESAWMIPRTVEARAMAVWFSGPLSPEASAHYGVDAGATVQCVRERDEAWAAPGPSNTHGIHVELAGQAMRTQWLTDGRPVLERAARLVARICERHNVRPIPCGVEGLLAGADGLALHSEATEAVRRAHELQATGSVAERQEADRVWPMWRAWLAVPTAHATHQDPGGPGGKRWPWGEFTRMVNEWPRGQE